MPKTKMTYTGKFRDLKKYGFTFTKLCAENRKVYINENVYPNLYIFVKDRSMRIPDFGMFTAPIIDYILTHPIWGNSDCELMHCTVATLEVRPYEVEDDEARHNLYLKHKNKEISEEEWRKEILKTNRIFVNVDELLSLLENLDYILE